jgi:MFS family permease
MIHYPLNWKQPYALPFLWIHGNIATNRMSDFKPAPATNPDDFQTGGWRAHWILIVCSLLYMVNYMDRVVIPVVQEMIKREMMLTDTQLGLVQTIFLLATGLLSFPIGFLIDRWSRTKSMGIFGLIWSVFTTVTGLATSFIGLIIPRVIVGVGKAGFGPGGTAIVTAAYPREKHGMVMGIFNLAMPLGMALGTVITGYIAASMGWRMPFFLFAGIGLIVSISAFTMKDYTTLSKEIAFSLGGLFRSIWEVIKTPTMRWFLPGYGLLNLTVQAQIAWMPTYFIRLFNWDTSQAGNLTSLFNLTAIIGAPVGGILADRWYKKDRRGRMWLAAIAAALCSITLIVSIFFFHSNFAIGLIFGLFFGALYMAATASLSAASQNAVSTSHKGLTFGLTLFSMYFLGGAWSPMLVGVISDKLGGDASGLMWAMIMSACGGLFAAACFVMGARHYIADEDKSRRPATSNNC